MTASDSSPVSGFSRLFTILLCLLACFYYYHFFFSRSYVTVDIEVERQTEMKIYWAAENEPFSEKRRAVVRILPDQASYNFFLTDIGRVDRLRIDPINLPEEALIQKISISQIGFETIHVDLEELEPLYDIGAFSVDSQGLLLESAGNDPNFLYLPEIKKTPINWLLELARYALICVAVVLVTKICAPLQHNYRYVVVMLFTALVFIVSMAAISQPNAHPDEYVHLDATHYYQDNWLPPEIEDPAIEETYSAYGISRLNNGEIYYLLAGKFSRLVAVFQMSDHLSFRLFNVFLFVCVVLYACASIPARLVALPLVLSPQVWYLFSYCGSDAFGLFLCFIVGCELVRPKSFLNRFLDPENDRFLLLPFCVLSLILGLLLLLKINYYPVIGLFYFWVLWRAVRNTESGHRKPLFIRLALLSILAMALAGLRLGADYYVNGPERQEKLDLMQEKLAVDVYKPSTELHSKAVTMYLKERGTTLGEVIDDHQWFGHSFVTSFGQYGYFTISARETYYDLVQWAFLSFIIYSLLMIGVRGTGESRVLALLSIALAVALIGASLHRSWTIDLQPQGRYLFPILSMLGILLAQSRHLFRTRIFTLLVCQLFVLSVYSFVFIALIAIPRLA